MIQLLTTVYQKDTELFDLSRDLMQIRVRDLYRAAPETVRRATHAFAAPIKGIGIDHSHVLKLRPCWGRIQGNSVHELYIIETKNKPSLHR